MTDEITVPQRRSFMIDHNISLDKLLFGDAPNSKRLPLWGRHDDSLNNN
jgi:hypothetical protein